MSRRQQPIDPHRKAEALALAEEHGSAEASRRTGISADTTRWTSPEHQFDVSVDVESIRRTRETTMQAE